MSLTHKRGVKQWRILAPTLFGLYFSHFFRQAYQQPDKWVGVCLLVMMVISFVCPPSRQRQKFEKWSSGDFSLLMMLFFVPHLRSSFKNFWTVSPSHAKFFGLTISLKKTVVMSQSAQPHTFKVDNTPPGNVKQVFLSGINDALKRVSRGRDIHKTWESFYNWSCMEEYASYH